MLADWDLWIRLARSGPAARCEQPHVAYLDHGASMHVQQADLAPAELAYLAEKHPELVEESAGRRARAPGSCSGRPPASTAPAAAGARPRPT